LVITMLNSHGSHTRVAWANWRRQKSVSCVWTV
jgi:hypothetical protein